MQKLHSHLIGLTAKTLKNASKRQKTNKNTQKHLFFLKNIKELSRII